MIHVQVTPNLLWMVSNSLPFGHFPQPFLPHQSGIHVVRPCLLCSCYWVVVEHLLSGTLQEKDCTITQITAARSLRQWSFEITLPF